MFNAKTWTGTGSSHAITGYGFSPDFAWVKSRNNTASHALLDTVRGNSNVLRSDNSTAEVTGNTSVWTSFDSDGFTLGADTSNGWTNYNSWTYVGWAWDAGTSNTTFNVGDIRAASSVSTGNAYSAGWAGSSTGTWANSDSWSTLPAVAGNAKGYFSTNESLSNGSVISVANGSFGAGASGSNGWVFKSFYNCYD